MLCGLPGRCPRGKRPPVPHLTVNLFQKGDGLFQRKGILGPPPLPQRAFFRKIMRCGLLGRFPRGKRPLVPHLSVNLFPKGYGLFQRKGIPGPPSLPQRAFFRKIMCCGFPVAFLAASVPRFRVRPVRKTDFLRLRKPSRIPCHWTMASASVYTGRGTARLTGKGQEALPLRVSRLRRQWPYGTRPVKGSRKKSND